MKDNRGREPQDENDVSVQCDARDDLRMATCRRDIMLDQLSADCREIDRERSDAPGFFQVRLDAVDLQTTAP